MSPFCRDNVYFPIDYLSPSESGCGKWLKSRLYTISILFHRLLLVEDIGINLIPSETEVNAGIHAAEEGVDLARGAEEAAEAAANAAKDIAEGTCFVAGTPVQMADGTTKPIEKIKAGDEVMCRDPETGKTETKKVTRTFVHEHKSTLLLILSGGEQIEATPDQPFFVDGKGFVAAGDLQPGMALTSLNGFAVKVLSASPKQSDVTVYNLEVEKDHSYFVGKTDGGVVVHNINCLDAAFSNPVLRADHFSRHGSDFGATTAEEYEKQASDFLTGHLADTLEKTRLNNGDIIRYNQTTDEFGVLMNSGDIKTYFKPDPAYHGYPTNLDYFNAQH